MMSSFARILLFSAAAILFIGDRVSAYTYPIGVQIYTGIILGFNCNLRDLLLMFCCFLIGCLPYEDFMGDYYDCKRFYRCSNGWKSSLYCPDGTVYDQSIRTCVNSPTGSCIKFANSPYGVNYNGKLNRDQFRRFFENILRINRINQRK